MVPEALGLGNWIKAQEWAALPGGQATYLGNAVPWGTLPTILAIEFISIAFVASGYESSNSSGKIKMVAKALNL